MPDNNCMLKVEAPQMKSCTLPHWMHVLGCFVCFQKPGFDTHELNDRMQRLTYICSVPISMQLYKTIVFLSFPYLPLRLIENDYQAVMYL